RTPSARRARRDGTRPAGTRIGPTRRGCERAGKVATCSNGAKGLERSVLVSAAEPTCFRVQILREPPRPTGSLQPPPTVAIAASTKLLYRRASRDGCANTIGGSA